MYIEQIVGIIIILFVIGIFAILQKKNKWINTKDFDEWKIRISRGCNDETLRDFITFLKNYKGGYVRRRNGNIVYQDFLGREKGDLKGIFYNVVIPNNKVSVEVKEEYRKYIVSIGVEGVRNRPIYEKRDGKLKNNAEGELKKIKYVGNRGEKLVREYLTKLDNKKYLVVSGVVLKNDEAKREYDHIVIGNDVIFVIETKAFGISGDNKGDKCNLYIDKGDCWRIRKWGETRDVESPTKQIVAEKELMESIINDTFIKVVPILVLPNPELILKQNISLDYKVLLLKDLLTYMEQQNNQVLLNDRMDLLKKINSQRIN